MSYSKFVKFSENAKNFLNVDFEYIRLLFDRYTVIHFLKYLIYNN